MTSLSARLRDATRPSHEGLDHAPFFKALNSGALPKQSVVAYLRGLSVVHGVLERSLELAAAPALWDVRQARLPALLSDLEAGAAAALPDVDPAVEAALALGDEILLDAGRPARLMGRLYVLEGSMLGGQILGKAFAAALGTPQRPLAYLDPGPEGMGPRWASVKQRLDSFPPEDAETMTAAAASTFEGVARLATACFPYEESSLRRRVTALNPEAGRHAMPQNESEIALALRAADAAWRRHPYLEARYGARGRRFTLSDSCWLASLRPGAPEEIIRSLRWLAGVLAVRGLPTLILERHLEALDAQFGGAVFAPAVEDLRARRRAVLPEADSARIVGRWKASLPDLDAAELLAAALADEAAGAAGAWESVRSWFADPARCPEERGRAVDELAAEIRAALRPPVLPP